MSEQLEEIKIVHEARLSDRYSISIRWAGVGNIKTEWHPTIPKDLTDDECHKYGRAVGQAYTEAAQRSGKTLMFATDIPCALGLLEGGATHVETEAGKAFAIFAPGKVQ